MKKSSGLTARKLRILLLVGILAITSSAIGGFYFAQQQLLSYAEAISTLNADANAGDKNIATLKKLEVYLKDKQSTIAKTKAIVAESKEYVYQDEIIRDLVAIGQSSGVTVTGFTFGSPGDASGGGTAATTPSATPTPTTPVTTSSGLKSQAVTVAFESPLNYNNLMEFIKKIELNPLKMQIASVSLTKDTGALVTSQSFSIEVYVR